MSLEQSIENLAKVVDNLNKLIEKQMNAEFVPHCLEEQKQTPAVKPVPTPDQPLIDKLPIKESKVRFKDSKEFGSYITESWKQLGREKGMKIQEIFSKLGYENVSNLSDIKSLHYDEVYDLVEEMKK